MLFDVAVSLDRALEALVPALDIVDGRVEDGVPPAWCEARGWTRFLLGLDDAALERCEAEGLAAYLAGAPSPTRGEPVPASLAALAAQIPAAIRVPAVPGFDGGAVVAPPPRSKLRSVGARKELQLGPLLAAVGSMAGQAGRIVDVGAGRGHFTRLAAERFDREALGLDREPSRVAAAEALAGAGAGTGAVAGTAPTRGGEVRFATFDAGAEELVFAPTDLAVGLHACGELGDRMVIAAARAGCDLALISCCLQKIGGPARAPLSRAGRARGLSLPREALGLTNLTARPVGVEGSLRDTMAARERRHALLRLLRARGLPLSPGEEMRGINRRRAHEGFAALAGRALALRGLAPATAVELAAIEAGARASFARVRRLTLPRSMLSRLTEVTVILDRAAALADRGHAPLVATLFDAGASPRNLGLFASRDPGRLPLAVPPTPPTNAA